VEPLTNLDPALIARTNDNNGHDVEARAQMPDLPLRVWTLMDNCSNHKYFNTLIDSTTMIVRDKHTSVTQYGIDRVCLPFSSTSSLSQGPGTDVQVAPPPEPQSPTAKPLSS
jgi:hypothetical protein